MPSSSDSDNDAPQAPRRPLRAGERVAGSFFRLATRWTGLRPSLVPAHLRRQLSLIGVHEDDLARVLRNLRSLGDWPYAWEAEGDRLLAEGREFDASAAWYVGQRLLLTDSALKRRLYRQSRELYAVSVGPQLEHIRVEVPGGTVAGYLALPHRTTPQAGGFPTVFMLPGVTSTKEELHVFAEPLVQRGWAVVRIDNPGYGETTGTFAASSLRNITYVMDDLAADSRLNADQFHIFAMSLGGHCALHSSYDSRAASTTVIAAPFAPHTFLHELPVSNLTGVQRMLDVDTFDETWKMVRAFDLSNVAERITIPVNVIHGGRDRTVPVTEATRIASSISGPAAVTIFERDHHNCLEHFEDMMALTLEWLDDPEPLITAYARSLVDAAMDDDTTDVRVSPVQTPSPRTGTEPA